MMNEPKRPLVRNLYVTAGGVVVQVLKTEKALRRGKREWRAWCVRAATGRRHGWIWARILQTLQEYLRR